MRVLLAIVLAAASLACPPAGDKNDKKAGPAACTRVGQSCELSPGKLGTCVKKDECSDPAGCFVCQSQH